MDMTSRPTVARKYEETHPWLKFELHLKDVPWELWLLLGECRSKCDHLAGVPLRPEVASEFYRVYLAKGAHGSAAIEGNTLSVDQVYEQVEHELKVPESQEYLQREVDNIIQACNTIGTRIHVDGDTELTVDRIKEYNRWVLDGAELDEGMQAGVIPDQLIGVGSYPGAPREDCEYLLERLCEWIARNRSHGVLEKGLPILMAVVAHVYFEWIHPFPDGNGRTGRLIEFHILNASGIPAPASHLLSNFYNQTRSQYYKELQNASKSGGDLSPFLLYALRGFRDGLKEQIEKIRDEQLQVAWINYVHTRFEGKDTTTAQRRRRRVALALGSIGKPVALNEIPLLTPKIGQAYGEKTTKTLKRDVAALENMELIKERNGRYMADIQKVEAWLPSTVAI